MSEEIEALPVTSSINSPTTNREPGSPNIKRRRVETVFPQGRTPRRREACQQCRGRKVKCDNARPDCGSCVTDGRTCIYEDPPPDQPVLDSTSSLVLTRLDQILHGVQGISSTIRGQYRQPTSHNGGWELNSTSPPSLFIPERPSVLHRDNHRQSNVAPSEDYLRIPSGRSCADEMLTWPVFQGRFSDQQLAQNIFRPTNIDTSDDVIPHGIDMLTKESSIQPLDEERIPILLNRFLENVHTKNPILDTDILIRYGREAAANGLGWDAPSCLVLLACALGAVSQPFSISIAESPRLVSEPQATSISIFKRELHQAESYYILACRRLGLLRHNILSSHCFFFSGVYLMYTFRPLLAWSHFCQASTAYRIHLRSTSSTDAPSQDRLEQSLYWSCFKSECEFRVELPLPQTELADLEHPHMFPTPPSPSTEGIQPLTYSEASLAWNNQKQITEEMSWYYYLTELALRRMGNRILNTFYTYPHATWMQISRFIHAAREFEIQLSNWTDNLPAVMQYSENLRSPANELSWCTGNRILEIQAWLYQPFLYFALHKSSSSIPNSIQHQNVTQDDEVLRGLIRAGMDTHLRIIQFRTVQHRHHGLWFDLRAITSSAIFLCGCLISGNILLPEDWEERFESILRQLRFWEVESPDLVRTRGVLEELRDEARLAVATRTAEK